MYVWILLIFRMWWMCLMSSLMRTFPSKVHQQIQWLTDTVRVITHAWFCFVQLVVFVPLMHLIHQTSAVQLVCTISAPPGLITFNLAPHPQLVAGSRADEHAQGRQAAVRRRDAALLLWRGQHLWQHRERALLFYLTGQRSKLWLFLCCCINY